MRIFQSMNRPSSEEKKKSEYTLVNIWNSNQKFIGSTSVGITEIRISARSRLTRPNLSATLQISLGEVSARSLRHYKSRWYLG